MSSRVHLLNGGLYPELHRPQPPQTALLDPEQGPRISELVTEELFVAGLRPTFAEQYDAGGDSADIWAAMRTAGRADRPPADPLHDRP